MRNFPTIIMLVIIMVLSVGCQEKSDKLITIYHNNEFEITVKETIEKVKSMVADWKREDIALHAIHPQYKFYFQFADETEPILYEVWHKESNERS